MAGGPKLPDDVRLQEVHLRVTDLDRSLGFYQALLGLTLGQSSPGLATLSAPG
jgi:catechol-2,3-dioxygenase